MAKLAIKKASTDVTTYVFIQDSSKTTGVGLAGLAYNTGSLVGYYVRPKGSATAITLATQTVTGDHSDGGFVEIDATNMPGVYRLDLPDAVCATGVPSVVVMLKGATNMSPVVLEIQLTDFDLNTAAITVDGIADAVWDEAISGHTTGTTFGGKNQKVVPSETINDYKADVSGLATQTSVNAIPTTPLLAANYTAPDNATIGTIAGNVDDLETRLTAARAGYLDKLNVSGTLAHSNDAATYKADVSGLATSAEVGAIALLGETVIGSYTVQDILKILAAKMVGKATGGGTATITYRGVDDTSDVVVETVDTNGNRSAVTLTV
jgi:hypothetical protein